MTKFYAKWLLLLAIAFLSGIVAKAQSNQYLHFDGVDDYVSLPNATAPLNGSTTITMAGWFYTDALVYGQGMMSIRGGGNGSGEMYIMQLDNGKLECRVVTTTGLKQVATAAGVIQAGQWQHIAWVFNTNTIQLYINGTLTGNATASGTFQSTDKPFTIGRSIASNYSFYFGGRADEVSLWNKALTQTEIQNMMSNELSGSEASLVSYYKFNQGFPGGNNTSISTLLSENGALMNANLNNFSLNGNTSNFNGTLQSGAQVISFPLIPSKLTTDPAFQLNAIASSNLPVSYTIVSGPATVSGNTVSLNGTAGTVVVKASQPGNGTFNAAPDITVSFEVLDPANVLVNSVVTHPLAGNVYAPNLTPVLVAVRAAIAFPDLFSVQSVTATVDGTNVPMTHHGNGYYTGWWTPTTYGNHHIIITGTNNHNASGTTTLDFNLAQSAGSVTITGINQAWVKDDIPVVIQESELPSHIGAYDKIVGKLVIECPTGGCDPWDRVSSVEAQGKNGEWYEIIRYLTPYGVACQSEIDLTDFASLLLGKTKFRITLGTQGNGFLYTLNLEYRAGTPANAYSKIHKLWNNTYQFGDMGNLQPYEVLTARLNPNTQAAKIKLVATGHGWGNNNTGNAAEFQRNIHHIWVNGAQTFTHDNWNICNPNPDGCSPQNGTWYHNRAGWCPGSIAQFFDYNLNSFNDSVKLSYILDQSYQDLCHPNNPNCISGTTCADCNDNFNPHLVTSSYLIAYASQPTDGTVNIPGLKEAAFRLYPNPSSGKFFVEFGSALAVAGKINIYDIAGRIVHAQDVSKGSTNIAVQLKGQAAGIYIVDLIQNGQKSFSRRVVIE
ncbi:MAG: hypothetical protein BGO31_15500 [Bacteroidetes bacterium 43-16]|nr:MAG: hypothetical protein BGO31_15500 [Bacteroidetes bacterium 43-16]